MKSDPWDSSCRALFRSADQRKGLFTPGHLGELTQIVPFEMVDAALAETGAVQQRLSVCAPCGPARRRRG
ncbi:transposase domain-containing protein [Streptomyces hokutonensis]|uniref:Transposase domain-containing protein n=1 Tax=Streptomyces hokutonensis TaxID=1306990 RepID=A0ABW6MCA5_9ACTN